MKFKVITAVIILIIMLSGVSSAQQIAYMVAEGDTLESIAEHTGRTVGELLWWNEWMRYSDLQPGKLILLVNPRGYQIDDNEFAEVSDAVCGFMNARFDNNLGEMIFYLKDIVAEVTMRNILPDSSLLFTGYWIESVDKIPGVQGRYEALVRVYERHENRIVVSYYEKIRMEETEYGYVVSNILRRGYVVSNILKRGYTESYIVKEGDNLRAIVDNLGIQQSRQSQFISMVIELNNLTNPDHIYIEQVLLLPLLEDYL